MMLRGRGRQEREEEGKGECRKETRTLNVSSHVHFTPLQKMGCAGIIIALEQRGVRVKEKDEEERLRKGWCVMKKREAPRFSLPLLCGLYSQKAPGPV